MYATIESIVEAITALAAKTRRRDLVIDNYQIAKFYQSRLPGDVFDRARLEKIDRQLSVPEWTKSLSSSAAVSQWLDSPPGNDDSRDEGECLFMRPDDLVTVETDTITDEAYPDELIIGQSRLPLEYHFEPGSERDGIRVKVHQSALSQISEDRLGWLVPGMLQDKLVAMIKSLPKRIRRNLVPTPDVAAQIAEELQEEYGQTPFMSAVCAAMSRHAEMPITVSDFRSEKLSNNLQFLVTVVDDRGDVVAEGRNLAPLLCHSEQSTGEAGSEAPSESWTRESMTTFDIDQLPHEVIRTRGGVQVAQYPGLVDQKDAVATQLFADQATAATAIRRGLLRLFALTERKALRNQVRWLPPLESAKIKLAGVVSAINIEAALIDLLARIAFVEGEPLIRSKADFDSRRSDRGERIAKAAQDVAPWLEEFGDSYFAVRSTLESGVFECGSGSGKFGDVAADVRGQLDWLLCDSFLSVTPWSWLQHYPRYLQAIGYRFEKLRSGAGSRDAESMRSIQDLWNRWLATLLESDRKPMPQADSEFRWMMEELRVSLFAQPLGTVVRVSAKRCEKLLTKNH